VLNSPLLAGARLVLGGVAPVPWRVEEAEKILQGQKFSEGLARAAGEAVMADARPLRNNEYKIELAKALIRQALRMTVGSTSRAP
jgi:xanthine dehydrogenase YagS FAD-binding subunit